LPTRVKNKRERYTAYADRALSDMQISIEQLADPTFEIATIQPN